MVCDIESLEKMKEFQNRKRLVIVIKRMQKIEIESRDPLLEGFIVDTFGYLTVKWRDVLRFPKEL